MRKISWRNLWNHFAYRCCHLYNKTDHSELNLTYAHKEYVTYAHKEYVTSFCSSMWLGNLVGDKGNTVDFIDLVYWLCLLHNTVTSLSVLVWYLCVLYHKFHSCFPVISLRHSQVSGNCIAVVSLTWIARWLRLAFTKVPIRVGTWKQRQRPKR
jgi:hypothetical protein